MTIALIVMVGGVDVTGEWSELRRELDNCIEIVKQGYFHVWSPY